MRCLAPGTSEKLSNNGCKRGGELTRPYRNRPTSSGNANYESATGNATNRKGCDIGYALAASSCEGANSVETCTVTALDAITAFAVPNPNCSSQSQSVFSGQVALQVALLSRSPSLLRTGKFYLSQPFQPSTCAKLNSCFIDVNGSFHQLFKYLWM